jgi:hypothetical protein
LYIRALNRQFVADWSANTTSALILRGEYLSWIWLAGLKGNKFVSGYNGTILQFAGCRVFTELLKVTGSGITNGATCIDCIRNADLNMSALTGATEDYGLFDASVGFSLRGGSRMQINGIGTTGFNQTKLTNLTHAFRFINRDDVKIDTPTVLLTGVTNLFSRWSGAASLDMVMAGDGVTVITADANFTLTPGRAVHKVRVNVNLAAVRTGTLSTAGARDGDQVRVTYTGTTNSINMGPGLFTINPGGWALFEYDGTAAAWYVAQS